MKTSNENKIVNLILATFEFKSFETFDKDYNEFGNQLYSFNKMSKDFNVNQLLSVYGAMHRVVLAKHDLTKMLDPYKITSEETFDKYIKLVTNRYNPNKLFFGKVIRRFRRKVLRRNDVIKMTTNGTKKYLFYRKDEDEDEEKEENEVDEIALANKKNLFHMEYDEEEMVKLTKEDIKAHNTLANKKNIELPNYLQKRKSTVKYNTLNEYLQKHQTSKLLKYQEKYQNIIGPNKNMSVTYVIIQNEINKTNDLIELLILKFIDDNIVIDKNGFKTYMTHLTYGLKNINQTNINQTKTKKINNAIINIIVDKLLFSSHVNKRKMINLQRSILKCIIKKKELINFLKYLSVIKNILLIENKLDKQRRNNTSMKYVNELLNTTNVFERKLNYIIKLVVLNLCKYM